MSMELKKGECGLLLQLILAQRLEINAIESALKGAGILTDSQIQEIRKQAANAAGTWTQNGESGLLDLIRVHSSPNAAMLVPLAQQTRDELRLQIDDQTGRPGNWIPC